MFLLHTRAKTKEVSKFNKGPTTTSLNVLNIPDLSTLKCKNCGNSNINLYQGLDSYTFDINCNKCGNVVWKNPDREERMQQIDDMLG